MSFTYPADGRLWWLHTDPNTGRVIDEPITPAPEPTSLDPSDEETS